MIITLGMLNDAKTNAGGYSGAQIEYAKKLTGCSQWRQTMLRSEITEDQWDNFFNLKYLAKKEKQPDLF